MLFGHNGGTPFLFVCAVYASVGRALEAYSSHSMCLSALCMYVFLFICNDLAASTKKFNIHVGLT